MTIKFTRTEPGRYHADNGARILDAHFLSATIIRDGKAWTIRYFLGYRNVGHEDGFETLAEAKEVARRVLADSGELIGHDQLTMESVIHRLHHHAATAVINEDITRMNAQIESRAGKDTR